jgi:predicted SprT family Zn-dependent metalloprotease
MGLVEEAFQRLYPEKEFRYAVSLRYSGRFKAYNANARMRREMISFSLSRKWKGVDEAIKIGLIQELLVSLLKDRRNTLNMELYNSFIKNIHLSVKKTETHPLLEGSFERVNQQMFDGMVERPNLIWGQPRKRTLGTYSFNNDSITFNPVLMKDIEALDYVMYHELLHKKLKFRNESGRSYHHTHEFKEMERKFPNAEAIEKRLRKLTSGSRGFGFFDFF